ncbi:transcriptional regulator [Flavobacteriaceae bacterium F08102]|nr:transcriptional regulator [Flavobacteriaceae bacterium F08102]
MEESRNKQKCQLVEKLGVHLEQTEQIAPLAGRIMAYCILTGKRGVSFEDLVQNLCASKSTISTHLNHLQSLNKLQYFTKTGDRKKYFVINPNTIKQNIDRMIEKWETERKLHQEIRLYKEQINQSENVDPEAKFDLELHNNFIKFLNQAINSIKEFKETTFNSTSQN